jgi:hypothetical protein
MAEFKAEDVLAPFQTKWNALSTSMEQAYKADIAVAQDQARASIAGSKDLRPVARAEAMRSAVSGTAGAYYKAMAQANDAILQQQVGAMIQLYGLQAQNASAMAQTAAGVWGKIEDVRLSELAQKIEGIANQAKINADMSLSELQAKVSIYGAQLSAKAQTVASQISASASRYAANLSASTQIKLREMDQSYQTEQWTRELQAADAAWERQVAHENNLRTSGASSGSSGTSSGSSGTSSGSFGVLMSDKNPSPGKVEPLSLSSYWKPSW